MMQINKIIKIQKSSLRALLCFSFFGVWFYRSCREYDPFFGSITFNGYYFGIVPSGYFGYGWFTSYRLAYEPGP